MRAFRVRYVDENPEWFPGDYEHTDLVVEGTERLLEVLVTLRATECSDIRVRDAASGEPLFNIIDGEFDA